MSKKLLAIILCFAMIIPIAVLPVSAADSREQVLQTQSMQSAFADADGESLIVFVTGIGQSWSYLFDEKYTEDGAFEEGTLQDYENYAQLVADEKYIARWNLFNNYFDEALKDPTTLMAGVRILVNLITGIFTRKNTVAEEDVKTLLEGLFKFNKVNEDGTCDPRVVVPRYTMPVSQFPSKTGDPTFSEAKNRFYNCIPCKEVAQRMLGDNFEDYLYVYNYCAFSYTDDNVKGLQDFIDTILAENKVGAKKVILVPMSMGASVVSAYLNEYKNTAYKQVRRVVSIVGCWNGSDVVVDLLTQHYTEDSAKLFYNGLISGMIGEPWGYLVNAILRVFSKQALRDFIDEALRGLSDVIFLDTPSLLALVPDYAYDDIRPMIKSEAVLAQTDKYHEAQSTLKERLAALEPEDDEHPETGITFSFIAGYGLPFGAITSDYQAFGFMYSADKTNSDEIINITSTAPGTKAVSYNKVFEDVDGRVLSPDKSIDISETYYKDSTWFFYGQKHELEYNNVAIDLAINIALGNIKTIEDCDEEGEDDFYYPQFNGARNLKSLVRSYIPDLEKYMEKNDYVLNEKQQALYDKVIEMKNCTICDYDKDNALIEEFYNMLVDIGVYQAAEEPSVFSQFINKTLSSANNFLFNKFGAKGYQD